MTAGRVIYGWNEFLFLFLALMNYKWQNCKVYIVYIGLFDIVYIAIEFSPSS